MHRNPVKLHREIDSSVGKRRESFNLVVLEAVEGTMCV